MIQRWDVDGDRQHEQRPLRPHSDAAGLRQGAGDGRIRWLSFLAERGSV